MHWVHWSVGCVVVVVKGEGSTNRWCCKGLCMRCMGQHTIGWLVLGISICTDFVHAASTCVCCKCGPGCMHHMLVMQKLTD